MDDINVDATTSVKLESVLNIIAELCISAPTQEINRCLRVYEYGKSYHIIIRNVLGPSPLKTLSNRLACLGYIYMLYIYFTVCVFIFFHRQTSEVNKNSSI